MINSRMRRFIRRFHLTVDGLIGQVFYGQGTLEAISKKPHQAIRPNQFFDYCYSKRKHFSTLLPLPIHKNQSPATCDLKVYQDALVYSFILDNFPSNAKLLEVGGGESRVISALKGKFEIWNLDKLEGAGFGPKDLISMNGFNLVQDYIGSNNPILPNAYFDFVFSISTIEHIPTSPEIIHNSIKDIQRLLKPGGYSLHCIDALLYSDHYFVHPFVMTVYDQLSPLTKMLTFDEITNNNDAWLLPPFAFYTRWYHLVKAPLKKFGHPFSVNLLWQKE